MAATPWARVTARMLDGTEYAAEGYIFALADRLAFEERFGVSFAAKMAAVSREGDVPREALAELREEWVAYFGWCTLRRAGACPLEWEEFAAAVESLDVEPLAARPTAPAPPPGS